MFLIITEKPSAAENFSKALGGRKGMYQGKKYEIVNLAGHILEYVEPHMMVASSLVDRYKSWNPDFIPWNLSDMTWKKRLLSGRKRYLDQVKKSLPYATSGVVIATDVDPSGEGELLAWEVLLALKYKGPVFRMYFADEAVVSIQKAFQTMTPLSSDPLKDGDYVKALVRSKWDFASMQLTRLTTYYIRQLGFNIRVSPQGRLKSTIGYKVFQDLLAYYNYVKKPYYEVQFKDENGHVYRRKLNEKEPETLIGKRFDSDVSAKQDLSRFASSDVVGKPPVRKTKYPGALLDLADLVAILGRKGYNGKEVLATYQKMYDATIVSYPRTEDKYVSIEQFNELLPLVDSIAKIVGVDSSLLTVRSPRKTHVKAGGAHGANRPGRTLPTSLNALKSYGSSGPAIYEVLAKNYLAMLAPDYTYDVYTGFVKDYPDFITSFTIPVSQGFRLIFDSETAKKDEADDELSASKGFGSKANPFIHLGVNKRPPKPTVTRLTNFLARYDVGTGATRAGTISDMSSGKAAWFKDSRGVLMLTDVGLLSALMLDGSLIANVSETEKLFKAMSDVGKGMIAPDKVLATITTLVQHDKQVFLKNSQVLPAEAKKYFKLFSIKGGSTMEVKEKYEGVFAPTGETVRFNKKWGAYEFSDDECETLLNGDEITIQTTGQNGPYSVTGSLKEQEFNGDKGPVKYWGFAKKSADDYTALTAPFKKKFGTYTFSDDEEEQLRNGETLLIEAVSAKGKPYKANVTFERLISDSGNPYWGIKAEFVR